MFEFILKLLFPSYFEYQKEMEREMKKLEREVMKNER